MLATVLNSFATLTSNALAWGVFAVGGSGEDFNVGEMIVHHVSDSPGWGYGLSKAVLMMAISALIVLVGILLAVRGYDADGVPRTRLAQLVDIPARHFYEDIALKQIGPKHAKKVAPLLLGFFFFIIVCNFVGLIPMFDFIGLVDWAVTGDKSNYHPPFFLEGAVTATGNFNITATLAIITFFVTLAFGIATQGFFGHFKHLAGPKSAPAPVRYLLLVPIETMSMFVKPFALTMRLAANMAAGHIALLSLISLIFVLQQAWLGIPIVIASVALLLLEIIVCIVQAYVFALLSGFFIGMAVHPH